MGLQLSVGGGGGGVLPYISHIDCDATKAVGLTLSILVWNRPIANMATISPERGFSVATVARGWLPVFTCAVAGKTAAS